MTCPDRRTMLLGLAATASLLVTARGESRPRVTVHKTSNCGCCSGWAAHLEAAGYATTVIDTEKLNRLKAQLGVPADLWACHTAEVDGYVLEGHVPAVAVDRLLAQRPRARGLAVPGMPNGSPGMEGMEPETYEVILFGPQGQRVFARFKGTREL